MPTTKTSTSESAAEISARIDRQIASIGGWRGATLARMRKLIRAAHKDVREEWKWDIPVWSLDGIICTGEVYKAVVKLTFPKGASLADPTALFNSSLAGNTRRALDIREGEAVDAKAFTALVKAAIAHNQGGKTTRPAKAAKGAKPAKNAKPAKATKIATASPSTKPVRLLSGGNPQIAKAFGDAPVQAYIAALGDWRRDVVARIDALTTRALPEVQKAVKWNSPLYGMEGRGWFMGLHLYDKYVKVAFFRGAELTPLPPDPSKDRFTRYVNVREGALDEAQMTRWVKQAAKLPGWDG